MLVNAVNRVLLWVGAFAWALQTHLSADIRFVLTVSIVVLATLAVYIDGR